MTDTRRLVLDEATVVRRDQVSPSFVRLELGGPGLRGLGVDGPLLDQRFKLIFPTDAGTLPPVADFGDEWRDEWLALPDEERGSMRTYTIRDVVGEGDEVRLVVDVVVHDEGDGPEASGPGARFATTADVGDRLVVVAPRRGRDFGGIEFVPPDGARLLLVADETAVPAVYGILRDLPDDSRGAAFLEVPVSADVLDDVVGPPGVDVRWLPRDGAPRGQRLQAAVTEHVGAPVDDLIDVDDDEVDPDLWETPFRSSSGDAADAPDGAETELDRLYAWIAGEAKIVTGLRRHLTREAGLDRGQVAFMGYWREGVAMRS